MRDQVLVRRRPSSTRSRRRWRARCRTAPSTARPSRPARRPASISISAGCSTGNTINLTYTDNLTGTQRTRHARAGRRSAALPLPASATADPNDKVIGVDFSGGLASVVAQLNERARLDRHAVLQSGRHDAARARRRRRRTRSTSMRVSATADGDGAHRRQRASCRSSSTAPVPYYRRDQPRSARRASALPAASRSTRRCSPIRRSWWAIRAGTAAGDATRPNFIFDRLTSGVARLSRRETGIGTAAAPFSGSLHVLPAPGDQPAGRGGGERRQPARRARRSWSTRCSSASPTVRRQHRPGNGESAQLQTAYGANARVMSTVETCSTC